MNEPMKQGMLTVTIAAIALFLAGFWWVDDGTSVPVPDDSPALRTSSSTNFVKMGTITVGNPGQQPGTAVFVYEEPGAPALTTSFTYDEFSFCVVEGHSLPCLAMSATPDAAFGGKRVLLEGEKKEGTVLVRKLHVIEENQPPLMSNSGSVFIGWADAQSMIRTCNATTVMQTHSLDVLLTLRDGQKVRTVEPVIDAVFAVVTEAQKTCGVISVATE